MISGMSMKQGFTTEKLEAFSCLSYLHSSGTLPCRFCTLTLRGLSSAQGCVLRRLPSTTRFKILINWKEDIERAIWDENVCKEVLEKWEGMEVVESVRKYVKDAREKMGPSFLEVVCEEMSDEALRQVFGSNMEEDENEGSHDQSDATKACNMEGNNTADAREKPSFPKVVADDMSADEDTHDQTNATEASLKEGNKTVRDESTDGAAGPASGPQLPTPKKSVVSPVKKDENPKPLRRNRKPWSNIEEGTLRTGVKKYGVGNWKFILNEYKDIFDDRTAVDLKDKWRNLIV